MSLFDGSGSFPLAGKMLGIEPVYASEIEPFPILVTRKNFPNMKHLGSVVNINGAEIEPVDIVTFGSPCQDLSVAGKRAGLNDGERSSLFYEAIRIIKEMRDATDGRYPRFAVWENVFGAFSSNGGADFAAVLTAFCNVCEPTVSVLRPDGGRWLTAGEILADGYSVAWRGFDAQYHGVPQRRKRIYLVGDFNGQSAGKILFESESLSGYNPQGWRSWQRTSQSAEKGTDETGRIVLNDMGGQMLDVTEDVTGTLRAQTHGHEPAVLEKSGGELLMFENHAQDSRYKGPIETAQTLSASCGTGGNNQPLVMRMREGCEGGAKDR